MFGSRSEKISGGSIPPLLHEVQRGAPSEQLATRVDRAVSSRSHFPKIVPGLAAGLAKSPTLRTIAVTALVGGLATGILFIVVSSPPAWMIAAVAGGGAGVGLLLGVGIQLPFKGKQKAEFEFSALSRLFKSQNYNPIITLENGSRVLLGALPNRIGSDGEHLVNMEGVGAVLSVNENWEISGSTGLSVPYQLQDWGEMGVNFQTLPVLDHTLLEDDALNMGADYIDAQTQAGKTVYVHCRAGVGRSAMVVAAFLIKHRGMTVEEARTTILAGRPISTINKKLERLAEYQSCLENLTDEQLDESADFLHQ